MRVYLFFWHIAHAGTDPYAPAGSSSSSSGKARLYRANREERRREERRGEKRREARKGEEKKIRTIGPLLAEAGVAPRATDHCEHGRAEGRDLSLLVE